MHVCAHVQELCMSAYECVCERQGVCVCPYVYECVCVPVWV